MSTKENKATVPTEPALLADDDDVKFRTPEDDEFEAAEKALAEAQKPGAGDDPGDGAPSEPGDVAAEEAENQAVIDKKDPEPAPEPEQSDKEIGLHAALTASREETRNAKAREANTARRLEEANATIQAGAKPTVPAAPVKTTEDLVAEVRAQQEALDVEFDEGDIGTVDHGKRSRALADQVYEIRRAADAPATPKAPTDSGVEANIKRLEGLHPALLKVSEARMKTFTAEAREFAAREGQPIGPGQMELMRLHDIIAKLVTHAYEFSMEQPAPVATDTPSPAPTKPVAPLSPEAKAREKAIAKKADHPPDLVNVGATPDAQITDEQHQARMEGMDESQLLDYIDAMPPGTYARLTDGEMPPGA